MTNIEPKQVTFSCEERITKDLIEKGLQQNIITIDKSDDLLAAYIGEYWFYICSDPDRNQEDFSQAQIIDMIWLAVNDEPINDDNEDYATECLYYKYFLEERIQP